MKPEQRVPINLYGIRKPVQDALSSLVGWQVDAAVYVCSVMMAAGYLRTLRIREWCEEDYLTAARKPAALVAKDWSPSFRPRREPR
jgi:hypothetical protein